MEMMANSTWMILPQGILFVPGAYCMGSTKDTILLIVRDLISRVMMTGYRIISIGWYGDRIIAVLRFDSSYELLCSSSITELYNGIRGELNEVFQ